MATVALRGALPSVRLGLASMLAEHGHRVASEGEALDGAVWVIDAPDGPALEALIGGRDGDLPRAVVVLTDDPTTVARLAHAGLRGWACLGRESDADELDLAVRAADLGLALLDLPTAAATVPATAVTVASATSRPTPAEPLTPRELQVLQLLAQGLPNKGIARALGISENTAKFHVASLSTKLGAASRTEAVALGARRGLIVL